MMALKVIRTLAAQEAAAQRTIQVSGTRRWFAIDASQELHLERDQTLKVHQLRLKVTEAAHQVLVSFAQEMERSFLERSEGRVQEANTRLAELQAQNQSLQQTLNALFEGLRGL
jgi:hypothetical protein